MSLTKSTTRRLSLMAGSSLVAASLTVFSAVALAPTAALAQATCTSGTAVTGNGTNAVTIAGGTNNPGITCAYVGDNALVATLAATTVSTTAPGGGINLSATGDDSINWNSTTGTVTGSTQTNGPVIDALTNTGDINITSGGVTGTAATVTHGIRAISSGGDITLNTGAVSATNATSGQYAIEAATTGSGNVFITTTGTINGRLRSILASSTGTGSTTVVASANVSGTGMEVSSGTGGFHVEVNGGTTNAVTASGPVGGEIYIGASGVLGNSATAVALTTSTSGGTVEVQNYGRLGNNSGRDNIVLVGSGAGDITINNNNNMTGAVDYSAMTGNVTINANSRISGSSVEGVPGRWTIGGDSIFGAGDDAINIAETGAIVTAVSSDTSIDFGAGEDTFRNRGALAMGLFAEGGNSGVARLELSNLEVFVNSGVIFLGSSDARSRLYLTDAQSDGAVDDLFVMRSGRFVGEEGSRIYLDALLAGTPQTGCDSQTAADCIDLRGAETEGLTLLRIRDASTTFDGFLNEGIVLIEGASAADHFALDPGTIAYGVDPALGPVIRKGLIYYNLVYNAEDKQHVLVGVLGSEGYQFQFLPSIALNTWRMATGTWLDRQADQRNTPGSADGGRGMWARGWGDRTSRELSTGFSLAGNTFNFDLSHSQRTGGIIVGADILSSSYQGGGSVFGAMLGYVDSVTEFDTGATRMEFAGPTGGLYASYMNNGLFIDGVVNAQILKMNQDAPGLNLGEGVRLKQDVTVVGAQLEGGWRIPVAAGFFAEPLAAFSWVRTEIEEIATSGALVDFDDKAVSRRAGLGLRLGMDSRLGPARATWSLTGRAWNEFEGENRMMLELPGETMALADDLSGTFGEVGAGIGLSTDDGLVSGFLNGNVKFQEDYRSTGFAAGVRLRW